MSKPIKPSKNQGERFSDLKVQSVAVQSCFINVCCQLLGT